MMKSVGSLDHPTAKWLLSEIEKGNELILEITKLLFYMAKCYSNILMLLHWQSLSF
jgi:hypothetical protein